MQLSEEVLVEFKAIWKEEFGYEITDEEAQEAGTRMLRVMMVIHDVYFKVAEHV